MEASYLPGEPAHDTISVVGGFPSLTRARSVVRELKEAGIPSEEISVVLGHRRAERQQPPVSRPVGRVPGVIAAAAAGSLAGLLLSSSSPTLRRLNGIPAIGRALPVVFAAALGAVAGSLVNPLAKFLILASAPVRPPARGAGLYPSPGILVGATGPGESVARAREILSRYGAEDLRTYGVADTPLS